MKMAVALLLVLSACSIGSAFQAGITPENTSEVIGNVVYGFSIPSPADLANLIVTQSNQTAGVFEYVLDDMLFKNETAGMACLVGVAYFHGAAPSRKQNNEIFAEDFVRETDGTIIGGPQEIVVGAGYPATMWPVINPINEEEGVICQVQVTGKIVIIFLGDLATFSMFKETLKVGVKNDWGVVYLPLLREHTVSAPLFIFLI